MKLPFRLPAPAKLGLFLSLLLGSAGLSAEDLAANAAEEGPAATVAEAALQPALLDVTVNGQRGEEPAQFLRGPTGALYVSANFLRDWRIRVPIAVPIRYEGQLYYPASEIPTLRLSLDQAAQSVAIDADPSAFERQLQTFGPDELMGMSAPSSGAFVNYDLFVEHVGGRTSAAGVFDGAVFTRHGAGATSFIASAGGDRARITRLETTWTIDRPNSMTTLRIGDSISFAGPGAAPVRFGGFQYARNFAVRPGYLTMPLPVAGGSAAVPSIVDVYVNSTLQGQQPVQPGPFELANIPVPSGGGTVQLVVRDLLGREIVSEQSYYASSMLLRSGLHDFSYEAGFLREDFGRKSNRYGTFFVSTTHRYGFSDRLTGEATAQASESRQMIGVALTAVPSFDLGQVGGSVAISHSEKGWGFRAAASFERRTSGFSFGLLADYTSPSYTTLGLRDDRPPPRYTVQAFADVALSRGGIGVNFLHRSIRDEPDQSVAGVFANWRVTPRASVQLYARRSMFGRNETAFGAHLSIALGGRRSGSMSFEHNRGGTAGTISYQDDPPAGTGGGLRAIARIGDNKGGELAYVRNLPMATVTAQASYVGGTGGVRLSATGSAGFMDGRGFAARTLGESFAAVRLDGYPGVRVYANNQPVGVTDRSGFVMIPGLHAFLPNVIRIEQADLPLDATLASEEVTVRPFARAGTIVRFPIQRERGAVLRISFENGSPLPAGAQISIEAQRAIATVVTGGEVYLSDARGAIIGEARWEGGTCTFSATIPDGEDPQPRIDNVICRERTRYAAAR